MGISVCYKEQPTLSITPKNVVHGPVFHVFILTQNKSKKTDPLKKMLETVVKLKQYYAMVSFFCE